MTALLERSVAGDRRRQAAAIAVAILAAIVASIATVFAFQAAGYAPCELCLKERLPFYAGLVLAAGLIPVATRAPDGVVRAGFAALAALFLVSACLGIYHAGVEWSVWPGPADCTGTPIRAATSADFLHQLRTVRVVRCDAAAIRVLGLSLAGWNAVASLMIAALSIAGFARLRP